MRELKFDGLSPDGTTLILVGKDGQKWSVTIDERIEAAVRRDRARIGQVEIEQAGVLRPREIQARIRAGATAEDVAAASGLPIEHIRRFEGPVLTERAWVAQQAQATEVRRPGGDIALGELVEERLAAEGVDPDDITWDAWRRDDGLWVVIATFPMEPNTHVATWTYDSGSRTMTVVDENAGTLSAITMASPLRLAATRPQLSTVAPLDDEEDDYDEPALVTSRTPWGAQDSAEFRAGDSDSDAAGEQDSAEHGDAPESEGAIDDGAIDEADVAPSAADEPAEEIAAQEQVPAADDEESGEPEPDADAADTDRADADLAREAGDAGTGLFPTPNTLQRPVRKPSVPSFDDILFGPGPGTADR